VEILPLPEADALDLVRDFQPDHRFASAAEETAARAIVRALGGYTLAVELAGAYLGEHAKEGYGPADFLQKLEREGLTVVDALGQEPRVAAQVRHERGQKQVGALLAWSVARLSPPARAALEFASVLQPDAIPLAWLEELVRGAHGPALAAVAGEPARWPGLWAELHGLRLMHPAEEAEVDEGHRSLLPRLVRLHRFVAAELAQADARREETVAAVDVFFDRLMHRFEAEVGKCEDTALRAQHAWLREQLDHLIGRYPTASLLRSAGVAADFEGEHHSLGRALEFTARILAAKEKILAANPPSARAARDVSVSLIKLADFLASRGQAGDAEQALGYYERSLAVSEQLRAANPPSAQAARDVSVSLDRLADFLARRGQAGDAEQALGYYERSLAVSEQLQAANPQSAQAARDVSISLERLAAMAAKTPGAEAAKRALAYQQRALGLGVGLYEANRASVFFGRTAAVSYFLTYQRAEAAGEVELAGQCLAGCHGVLKALIGGGAQLDAAMVGLFEQLEGLFGGK